SQYIVREYGWERNALRHTGFLSAERKLSCPPSFLWRHSQICLAWEYLRRSKEYISEYNEYHKCVSEFISKVAPIIARDKHKFSEPMQLCEWFNRSGLKPSLAYKYFTMSPKDEKITILRSIEINNEFITNIETIKAL